MNLEALSTIAQTSLCPALREHGFTDIQRNCLFVRRTQFVIHVVAFDKSRHGERVRVHLYPWLPEFASDRRQRGVNEIEQMLSATWARVESLGVYGIGTTKWWGVDDAAEAAKSLDGITKSLLREGLSWLGKFKSRDDVLASLVPDAPQEVRSALTKPAQRSLPGHLDQLPIWSEVHAG